MLVLPPNWQEGGRCLFLGGLVLPAIRGGTELGPSACRSGRGLSTSSQNVHATLLEIVPEEKRFVHRGLLGPGADNRGMLNGTLRRRRCRRARPHPSLSLREREEHWSIFRREPLLGASRGVG